MTPLVCHPPFEVDNKKQQLNLVHSVIFLNKSNVFNFKESGRVVFISPTWDVLGPPDVDHQLSVRQVTQRSQGLDVAVWYCWVRHGINLLWLSHQQVRDNFVICKAAKGNWHEHQTRRKTRDREMVNTLPVWATSCTTSLVLTCEWS